VSGCGDDGAGVSKHGPPWHWSRPQIKLRRSAAACSMRRQDIGPVRAMRSACG
jgi:hypothetical protein